jgi:hypothetical protein
LIVKVGIGRALALMGIGLLSGCAGTGTGETRSARLPSIELIEQSLERGVSRKADVERVLGSPNGRGGAFSGSYPDRPQNLWVYGEMGWSLIGFDEGTARVHVDQHLLMMFFEGEVYSGYWWHSSAGVATGTSQ